MVWTLALLATIAVSCTDCFNGLMRLQRKEKQQLSMQTPAPEVDSSIDCTENCDNEMSETEILPNTNAFGDCKCDDDKVPNTNPPAPTPQEASETTSAKALQSHGPKDKDGNKLEVGDKVFVEKEFGQRPDQREQGDYYVFKIEDDTVFCFTTRCRNQDPRPTKRDDKRITSWDSEKHLLRINQGYISKNIGDESDEVQRNITRCERAHEMWWNEFKQNIDRRKHWPPMSLPWFPRN